MPFRLSTLLLIFLTVVASLVLSGSPFGLIIVIGILLSALLLNHAKTLTRGIVYVFLLNFFVIIPLLLPAISPAREAPRGALCTKNLNQIGFALRNYHDAKGHFPPLNVNDKDGNPLLSWRIEILPFMDYGNLYNSLRKDEPWNSPHNAKLLSRVLPEYKCPSDIHDRYNFSTSYVAVIGPGTAWHEDGPIKLSDLPDGGSRTVMAVEAVNSGVHWAEPRDLTVEEALEHMKTRQGLRISTAHSNKISVLFADGRVCWLPAKMPISMWRKILAGEVKDTNSINGNIDESAPDMVDVSIFVPNIWPAPPEPGEVILALIAWLLSVVLLFGRAIESRRKPETAT
jgi:prepilin-type processing-associated H-X9-DG protein